MPVLNPKALVTERVLALRKAHADTGIPRAELDLSGGIDSAVMAGLLVLALGPENVTLVHTMMNTSEEQTRRAETLARGLSCRLAVGQFTGVFHGIVDEVFRSLEGAGYNLHEIRGRCHDDPTILGSIRSTLRAPLGRAYNRLTGGGIRHGTGNEDEDRFLRYYQKGGDGEVDSNPIAFLSKGEVYQVALALADHFDTEIKSKAPAARPQNSALRAAPQGAACLLDSEAKKAFLDTIRAMPSADLWGVGDKHTDEGELVKWLGVPFTYSRIDPETGEYTSVGTIERVNRFLDEGPVLDVIGLTYLTHTQARLFSMTGPNWVVLTQRAILSKAFAGSGLVPDQIEALLKGARKAEKQTRHKLNPNIPTYGSRKTLVEAGILTDELPVV